VFGRDVGMIIKSIKEGFRLTHKNWQVILLNIGVGIINLINFFIIVGIPVVIGIFFLGIDIAQAKDMLPGILENPAEIFSKYLGIAMLIFGAFLIYLAVASVLILYIFSGTLGVLRNAALNGQYNFSLSSFFSEAKKVFFPMLKLFSIALLVIILLMIVFGVSAGILISMISAYGKMVTTVSVFVTYFFILFGITVVLISIIFTAYAAIVLVVEKNRVMDSFRNTWNFIKNKPMAFVFYIILVFGIIAANLLLIALGASFSAAPIIGYAFLIPHRLISYVVQSYFGVVMWGSLIAYYIKATNYPVYPTAPTYDI
jgi:hypothetical protein